MVKNIYLNDELVGTAQVERQGLYYKLICRCDPKETARYKILLCCQNGKIDLGTCLWDGNSYLIKTRVPVKQVDGDMSFYLVNKECEEKTPFPFYPIIPNEPFSHIPELLKARLAVQNGIIGIICQEQVQRDSDQILGHR